MAQYQYDEGGSMATYFMLTFLSLILIPLTLSPLFSSTKKVEANGCKCSPCLQQEERIKKRTKRSILNPKLGAKATFIIVGWAVFAFLSYKVSTNPNMTKVYDPFEILGIRQGTSEKDIKSHYKKLSRKFHPDKVRLAVNQTLEQVESYFVDLTKAYKSLTDETIRKNLELYGHPDGRQEVSMGIAIPKWVVEGQHRFIVLIGYCAVLGGLLPLIVGKWWFGNRIKTKDGVQAGTAEMFFKSIKEDSGVEDLLAVLAQAYDTEGPPISARVGKLQEAVRSRLGGKFLGSPTQTLLYAYLLRIPIEDTKLQKAQERILLRSPTVLTSLLNIAMAHNWLTPTLNAMRLHAYLTQAIAPNTTEDAQVFTQLPNMSEDDVKSFEKLEIRDIESFISALQKTEDARVEDAKKAINNWGKIDLVEASFKVIGERIIVPSSIVQLLVKVRVNPPTGSTVKEETSDDVDVVKKALKANEEKDNEFLQSKRDNEEITDNRQVLGRAHAPYWPASRKPTWWILIGDDKTNRLVMPPMRISDVPLSDPSKSRNYRSYKMQFQAPQNVAMFTWKVRILSDTFLGEEAVQDIVLKVDDVSQLTADEKGVEDVISEPEEDSLAGQMALMKGSNVKKSPVHGESDDESGTDDGESSDESSSESD